ncbi:MAG TPA: 30S ribosomal protein S9 [Candidatus Kryptonia bacterium]
MASVQIKLAAVGRRKTSTARVRLVPGSGKIFVNNQPHFEYFPVVSVQNELFKAFEATESQGKYDVFAIVAGGGLSGQAGAMKLAIARALLKEGEELRPRLRAAGVLTRDPRMVERKKYGRKKARKRFQWTKR